MEAKKPRTKEAKVVLEEKIYDKYELINFEFNDKAPFGLKNKVEVISGESANNFLRKGYGAVCRD